MSWRSLSISVRLNKSSSRPGNAFHPQPFTPDGTKYRHRSRKRAALCLHTLATALACHHPLIHYLGGYQTGEEAGEGAPALKCLISIRHSTPSNRPSHTVLLPPGINLSSTYMIICAFTLIGAGRGNKHPVSKYPPLGRGFCLLRVPPPWMSLGCHFNCVTAALADSQAPQCAFDFVCHKSLKVGICGLRRSLLFVHTLSVDELTVRPYERLKVVLNPCSAPEKTQ